MIYSYTHNNNDYWVAIALSWATFSFSSHVHISSGLAYGPSPALPIKFYWDSAMLICLRLSPAAIELQQLSRCSDHMACGKYLPSGTPKKKSASLCSPVIPSCLWALQNSRMLMTSNVTPSPMSPLRWESHIPPTDSCICTAITSNLSLPRTSFSYRLPISVPPAGLNTRPRNLVWVLSSPDRLHATH